MIKPERCKLFFKRNQLSRRHNEPGLRFDTSNILRA